MTHDTLFEKIAQDIQQNGYSIQVNAIPPDLSAALWKQQYDAHPDDFKNAGVGRGEHYVKNAQQRTDKICWISENAPATQAWLAWASQLRDFLNQRLWLGLFSFESHFSHYKPGDYYKRHYDAFRGHSNRMLSLVTYLNEDWTEADAGELIIYMNNHDHTGIKVTPQMGTLVVFLSEAFPHEVLPSHRDRYSIAGWFRINASLTHKVDPPS